MKTKFKLLSILLLIMLTQSCTKDTNCGDRSDVVNNYNIAADDKAKIPYTGTDTLVFLSDKGDTATLIGQGKRTYYTTKKTNISGGDCEKNQIDNYENVKIDFIGNNSKFSNLLFKVYMYEKIIPKFPYIEILTNEGFRSLGSFQYLYGEDSIIMSGSFTKGVYIDDESLILYNYNLGVLKFNKLYNTNWKKIK